MDDLMLVDPGFGGNGFYLPFDPAQTGANYSSSAVANPVANNQWNKPSGGFDGNHK